MFEKLYLLIADSFFDLQKEGKDQWVLIKFTVPTRILCELYEKLLREGEIIAINLIEQDKKQKYYDIACRYWNNKASRIQASKAAYVLSLITSTD
jgi:hypothetical protein